MGHPVSKTTVIKIYEYMYSKSTTPFLLIFKYKNMLTYFLSLQESQSHKSSSENTPFCSDVKSSYKW